MIVRDVIGRDPNWHTLALRLLGVMAAGGYSHACLGSMLEAVLGKNYKEASRLVDVMLGKGNAGEEDAK